MSSWSKNNLVVKGDGLELKTFTKWLQKHKSTLPWPKDAKIDAYEDVVEYKCETKINPPHQELILASIQFPSLEMELFFHNPERGFVGYCKMKGGDATLSWIYQYKSDTVNFKVVRGKITPPFHKKVPMM